MKPMFNLCLTYQHVQNFGTLRRVTTYTNELWHVRNVFEIYL